jgi:pyruvate/2-oxoglutarate dehydrogenase complex dihydrolipoamide acyltransferase (E2) component
VSVEFRLPDVGEGIAGAEILEWLVAEGDRVEEHQDIVQIQTDKAVVEVPSPATGVVARLCAAEGDTVEVGAPLVVIDAAGEATPPAPPQVAVSREASPQVAASGEAPPLAAPSTRRLAREMGVDLNGVDGTGPGGRIRPEDVERAAESPGGERPGVGEAATPEVLPLRGTRRTIAQTLTKAWLEVPRVIDYREVDATALQRSRAALQRRARERGDEALAKALTPAPLIVRAAVQAATNHPYVNASIDMQAETITLHRHYNVGIAAAGPDGLTVPVIHDADKRGLADLAREIASLAQAARERRLKPDQLAGATLTVNNFGSLGTWLGTPIVRPPEVVNVGAGAIRDRVVAVDGEPVVRPTLVLCVAADHRVLDGDTLAAYVTEVAALLEDPVLLFEELT